MTVADIHFIAEIKLVLYVNIKRDQPPVCSCADVMFVSSGCRYRAAGRSGPHWAVQHRGRVVAVHLLQGLLRHTVTQLQVERTFRAVQAVR